MNIKRFLAIAIPVLLAGVVTPSQPAGAQAGASHCGTLSASETWQASANVHIVTCDVTVPLGIALTIEPGAIVKFQQDSDIIVGGRLMAQGTSGNPIYFTSYFDDSIGGDTDGTPATPVVGDWGQIRFSAGSDDTSVISRAVIRYSGSSVGSGVDDGAIRLMGASPSISFSLLTKNYRGIEALGGSTPALTCNDIQDNVSFGIYNDTPAIPVSAENHWWGSVSGPTHSANPEGTGQSVSDGVDYTPWAIQPCVLPALPPLNNRLFPPIVIKSH